MFCITLFILGVSLILVAKILGSIIARINEQQRIKKIYEETILNTVLSIENTLVPKKDKIAETVQAIKNIQAKKLDREAVDNLIDDL